MIAYIHLLIITCATHLKKCTVHLSCYSIYDGSLGLKESDAEDVLRWISLIAMEDNIEHVSEQMLERLLQDHKVIIEMNLYSREKAF